MAIERPDWSGGTAVVPASGVPATSDAGLTPAIVPDGWTQSPAPAGDQSAVATATLERWNTDGTITVVGGIVADLRQRLPADSFAKIDREFEQWPVSLRVKAIEAMYSPPTPENFERWLDRFMGKLLAFEQRALDKFMASVSDAEWLAIVTAICRGRR